MHIVGGSEGNAEVPDVPPGVCQGISGPDGPPGEDFFRGTGYIAGLFIRFGELVGLHEKPDADGYYPSDKPLPGSDLHADNTGSRWDQLKKDMWG